MLIILPVILSRVLKTKLRHVDNLFLKRLHSFVLENLDNINLNSNQICKEIGVSATQLRRKMKILTGESPNQFIRTKRLQQAARLIREEQLGVSEAAYQAGFNHMSYFSKCFRKEFGILPSEY